MRPKLFGCNDPDMKKILFVCLGNICRSPLAEGILRHKVKQQGLEASIQTDSCGTGGWHEGEPSDHRSIDCAQVKGIDISDLRARKVKKSDFELFDLIIAMDDSNYRDLHNLCSDAAHKLKIKKMLSYHQHKDFYMGDVPDPYHEGAEAFERVYQMLDKATDALLKEIIESLRKPS